MEKACNCADVSYLKEQYKKARLEQIRALGNGEGKKANFLWGVARGVELALVRFGFSKEDFTKMDGDAIEQLEIEGGD